MRWTLTTAALASMLCTVASGQPFALKDHDTVVFYGDSITAQRLYTRFVEDFVLTRYPGLRVQFVNAGVGGDKVSGGYAGTMTQRVHRDVEPFRPDMITVMLGMNDGGYGYTPADAMHADFRKGYDALLDSLHLAAPQASFTLLNPTPYDEVTHGTKFPGYAETIDELSGDVSAIASAREQRSSPAVLRADLHLPIANLLTRAHEVSPQLAPLLIPDRIHPGEAVHWVMAEALMKAWHVDPVVSRVAIGATQAKAPSVSASEGAKITALQRDDQGLTWSELDDALPLPLGFDEPVMKLVLAGSDIASWDQEMLRIDGLPEGKYQLSIDKKGVAIFSNTELAGGINLALLNTPMVEQAKRVDGFEEQRAALDRSRFILSADLKGASSTAATEESLRHASDQLSDSAHTACKPVVHQFELRRQPSL